MRYFVIFLLFSIPFIAAYAQSIQEEYALAELRWAQACFRIFNITATATVQVTDLDMNRFSGSTDTIKVFVYSDRYPEGIALTLYETDFDSGVFERTFGLSDQRSAPSVLYTQEGDTITAEYVDTTLPPPHTLSDQLELTETAFIGCSSPPLERVSASSARIVDSVGNTIDRPAVGEQVHITSDIANGQNREEKFSWIAQIMDDRNKVVSLGWINGVLNPESSFSPSVSWIPQKIGQYSATMFVWESLDNPSALSPPISIDIEVGPEELRAQRYGSSEMFLFIIPQENFRIHISTEKLSNLHFYKIEKADITKMPRLDLLLDMLHSFPAEYSNEIAVRINDSILTEYMEFFRQKCLQRTFANEMSCQDVDMAFEFEEKWYLLNVAGRPNVVLEESTPSWDEDFFNRYKPYDFYDSRENRSGVSLDRAEWVSPKKQAELGVEPWCNPASVLITKSSDGSSACVKPETRQILLKRGWAIQTQFSVNSSGVPASDPKCDVMDTLTLEVFHCPAISAPTKMEILQIEGFDICKKDHKDKSYILKPGETGKITYTIYRGMDGNNPPFEPQYKEILTEPSFLHEFNTDQGRSRTPFTPDSVHATYESDLPKLGFNQTATVTVTVSVDPNATEQVMWLGLPPFTCHGGAYVKFAIIGE